MDIEVFDMDDEEERRIGRAVVPASRRARELEVAQEVVVKEHKAAIQAAKDKVQWDLASMASDAMDTMRMGLQSEDEGIRMKALSMYLDRMAPRVGVVREETVIEVVDEAKKLSLGEIEELLRKKGMIEDGSN